MSILSSLKELPWKHYIKFGAQNGPNSSGLSQNAIEEIQNVSVNESGESNYSFGAHAESTAVSSALIIEERCNDEDNSVPIEVDFDTDLQESHEGTVLLDNTAEIPAQPFPIDNCALFSVPIDSNPSAIEFSTSDLQDEIERAEVANFIEQMQISEEQLLPCDDDEFLPDASSNDEQSAEVRISDNLCDSNLSSGSYDSERSSPVLSRQSDEMIASTTLENSDISVPIPQTSSSVNLQNLVTFSPSREAVILSPPREISVSESNPQSVTPTNLPGAVSIETIILDLSLRTNIVSSSNSESSSTIHPTCFQREELDGDVLHGTHFIHHTYIKIALNYMKLNIAHLQFSKIQNTASNHANNPPVGDRSLEENSAVDQPKPHHDDASAFQKAFPMPKVDLKKRRRVPKVPPAGSLSEALEYLEKKEQEKKVQLEEKQRRKEEKLRKKIERDEETAKNQAYAAEKRLLNQRKTSFNKELRELRKQIKLEKNPEKILALRDDLTDTIGHIDEVNELLAQYTAKDAMRALKSKENSQIVNTLHVYLFRFFITLAFDCL
ncbi:hypothetical protein QAD02_009800 [Eretmocerus hayati]|uniref:Uncharacterized protein n=1 Tax=Eretmocerus hayati TaxID=131215 RepID=A0ACC2NAP2_9HYME|nr:hypothetical protein QAD02_009800 [Eretmocerus hayati]